MLSMKKVWSQLRGQNLITVLVEGDKQDILLDQYRLECLTRSHRYLSSWTFYGMLLNGSKSLGTFWKREYGKTDPVKYDTYILSRVEALFREEETHGRHPWFQHDNALCHRSQLTQDSLQAHGVRTIP